MISRIIKTINTVSEKSGQYVSYLFIPLTLICLVEVMMRYVFNRPTVWAWDVERQLFGVITVVGASYTLLHKAHVSIDIFMSRFSSRKRTRVKLFTSSLFLVIALVVIRETSKGAIDSVRINEVSSSYWVYPMYPIKIAIALGVMMLFIQWVAEFLSTLSESKRRDKMT